MPKLVHPSHMTYNSMIDSIYSVGHRIGKDSFVRQQRATVSRIDSRPYPAGITPRRTMVLCGREDVLKPLEVHTEMVAAIPGSKLVVIDECGHLSRMAQPKLVSDAMRGWLRSIAYPAHTSFPVPSG